MGGGRAERSLLARRKGGYPRRARAAQAMHERRDYARLALADADVRLRTRAAGARRKQRARQRPTPPARGKVVRVHRGALRQEVLDFSLAPSRLRQPLGLDLRAPRRSATITLSRAAARLVEKYIHPFQPRLVYLSLARNLGRPCCSGTRRDGRATRHDTRPYRLRFQKRRVGQIGGIALWSGARARIGASRASNCCRACSTYDLDTIAPAHSKNRSSIVSRQCQVGFPLVYVLARSSSSWNGRIRRTRSQNEQTAEPFLLISDLKPCQS